MTQIAEQGKSNRTELVHMSGQITAVLSQLNNLQSMLTQAFSQQQQQNTPQLNAAQQQSQQQQSTDVPTNDNSSMEQSSYGKGDFKNARIAASSALNHNMY